MLNLLSGFGVDEAVIFDLSASKNERVDCYMLEALRCVADYPLTYGGGIVDASVGKWVMKEGWDKLLLNGKIEERWKLATVLSQVYGRQAIAMSIDYNEELNERSITLDSREKVKLSCLLQRLPLADICELLLTSSRRVGKSIGLDNSILVHKMWEGVRNPLILSGGCRDMCDIADANKIDKYKMLSGVAISRCMFMQSNDNSALVCQERWR